MKSMIHLLLVGLAVLLFCQSATAEESTRTYQDLKPLANRDTGYVKELMIDPVIGGCRAGHESAETKKMYSYDVLQDTESGSLCAVLTHALDTQKKIVVYWEAANINGKKLRLVKRVNYLAE